MGGALALLAALEAAAAPLRVLDLGGNELCGGTVAEDHSFGAVHGAALTPAPTLALPLPLIPTRCTARRRG